jgi:hypothetical protein
VLSISGDVSLPALQGNNIIQALQCKRRSCKKHPHPISAGDR